MEPYYYFILTDNCNLECAHCYMSAGPGKKNTTINEKNFRKIINHLPKIKSTLKLSGGEIFTIKNKLYGFLDYLRLENKKRKKFNQRELEVIVQTNGFWATSDKRTEQILSELKDFGVVDIDISSDDKYHREQGLKKEKIERIIRIGKESRIYEELESRGAYGKKKVMPMGRAKNFNIRESQLFLNMGGGAYCKGSLTNHNLLTIKQDGEVLACCFGLAKLGGNAIKEPLVEIVRRARKNKRLSLLNEKGIRGLASKDGWEKIILDYLISKNGECGFCYRFYSGGLINNNPKEI